MPSPVAPHGNPASIRSERIGDRFGRRLAEERLGEVFASAPDDASLSIGLIEIESDPTTAGLSMLSAQVAQRIATQLPAGARLVWSTETRFVVAITDEPTLEALMSMDRVRDGLERERWRVGEEEVTVAFGAGVATRRRRDEPVTETLQAAERSLAHSRRLAVRRHGEHAEEDAVDGPSLQLTLDLAPGVHSDR